MSDTDFLLRECSQWALNSSEGGEDSLGSGTFSRDIKIWLPTMLHLVDSTASKKTNMFVCLDSRLGLCCPEEL